jgi:hypothetical protein
VWVVLSFGSGSHRLGIGTAAAAVSAGRAKGGYFVSRLESGMLCLLLKALLVLHCKLALYYVQQSGAASRRSVQTCLPRARARVVTRVEACLKLEGSCIFSVCGFLSLTCSETHRFGCTRHILLTLSGFRTQRCNFMTNS